jgi:hypothetical protein
MLWLWLIFRPSCFHLNGNFIRFSQSATALICVESSFVQFEIERRTLEAETRSLKRSVADLDSALSEATESNSTLTRDLEATKAKLMRLVCGWGSAG